MRYGGWDDLRGRLVGRALTERQRSEYLATLDHGGGIEIAENAGIYVVNDNGINVIATKTVAANSMGDDGIVEGSVWFYLRQNTGVARQLTYTFSFGAATIVGTVNIASGTNEYTSHLLFVVQNMGATNSQRLAASELKAGRSAAGAFGGTLAGNLGYNTGAEDTTAAVVMKIELQMAVASANYWYRTLGARFYGPS